MINFEQEKAQLIAQIQQRNILIDGLTVQNGKSGLLSIEQLAALEDIKAKNQKYAHKLASNEFEIAIVGLEKAGKSTFANALIKNTVLPSAPERCTFTSTRLISGANKATVQFYTEAEFDEIFQELLIQIKYSSVTQPQPESHAAKKNKLTTEQQDKLEKLRTRKQKIEKGQVVHAHAGITESELKRLSQEIAELEGLQAAPIPSQETIAPQQPVTSKTSFRTLSLAEFERYFNSLEEKDSDLYKSHIGKTDEEIKDILKVRDRLRLDGKTLSFTGDQLKTDAFQAYIKGENKGQDTSKPRSVKRIEIESSELKQLENAIIYDVPGFDSPTKIHMRQTEERLKAADAIILVTNVGTNPSLQGTTLSVITKNTDEDGIHLKDKLFVFGNQLDRVNNDVDIQGNTLILQGDVEKYKIGERKRVFTGSAYKYLSENGIVEAGKFKHEVNANVDEIRQALIDYYQTERFYILKRKVDTNHKIMQAKLAEIVANLDPNEVVSQDSEQAKITKAAYKAVEERLEWELQKLRDDLKEEILEETYFSRKFQQSVHDQAYFEALSEEEFERNRILEDDSVRLDLAINRINQKIRERLHKQYLEEFNHLIKNMTDYKIKEVEIRLLRTFATAIAADNPAVLTDIEPLCKKYIHKVTHEVAHGENSFTYLLERFSRDIFDVLLSAPVLSQDRKNRYLECVNEYVYLDSYYSNGTGVLVNMILSQRQQRLLAVDVDSLAKVVNTVLSMAKHVSAAAATIDKLVEFSGLLKDASPMLMIKDPSGVARILENATRSNNQTEVLQEINVDIANLKNVLVKAVIPAANMELAFLNGIDKQVKRLIAAFKSRNSQFADDWDSFIAKVVPIIKADEFSHINDKIEAHKIRQQLIDLMQQALI